MIIEYEEQYLEDVKDLLVELEEYILTIDQDHLDQLHPDYREMMAELDLKEVSEKNGKCFLAIEDGKAVGLIMGILRDYERYDYLDYKCPKSGKVTELIVSKNVRGKGLGQKLMNRMEAYFQEMGCSHIFIDVFAYNEKAIQFYDKKGYHNRMHVVVKEIKIEEE